MKKKSLLLILILFLMALPAYADSLESVRVIKFWPETHDLIVERANGEQLLIQHHKACSTMSREFPVKLVWEGGKVTQVKVEANEICDVYNFGPFSSEAVLLKRIESSNALVAAHEAEIEWNGGRYQIDYSEGCTYLKDYVGSKTYIYEATKGSLDGATLYLPKARGMCTINSAQLLETLDTGPDIKDSMINNLRIKAENNQAFFSWDAFPENEIWIALLTYSKYPFDPSTFDTNQLPNLKRTRASNIRVLGLVNDQKYYFYLAASNGVDGLTDWQEVQVTPVQTIEAFVNQGDQDPFEIKMTETDDEYVLTWPDKAEDSRKYLIQLYVDGKREIFKLIDADVPEFRVPKLLDWSLSRFRLEVRSIPKKPTGHRFHDSIFWRKG